MKKLILTTLVAIGLVGCSRDTISPELYHIGALGCNTLGLQFEGVKQNSDWGSPFGEPTITVTVYCGQNIQIILNGIPRNPQPSAPAKAPTKALKDA